MKSIGAALRFNSSSIPFFAIAWLLGCTALFFFVYFIIHIIRDIKLVRKGKYIKGQLASISLISKTADFVYTVDGRKYTKSLHFPKSSWKSGQFFDMFYDPEKPHHCCIRKYSLGGDVLMALFCLGMAGFQLIIIIAMTT